MDLSTIPTEELQRMLGESSAPQTTVNNPSRPLSEWSTEELLAAAEQPEPKKFGLGDTWPARVAKSIYSGLTLPGDVMSGKAKLPSMDASVPGSVEYGSPESSGERVADMTMLASPIGAASRSGAGWAGVVPSPSAGQQASQAAGRIGVDIPRAAASDNVVTQRLGQVLSNVPFGGTSLRKAGEQATVQLGEAAERASAMPTGARVLPEQAGATARAGLEKYITTTTADRATKLYNAVDSLVDQSVTAPLSSTSRVAGEIMARRGNAAIAGESGALREVVEALSRPQGLNYQGVKDLRTAVGEKLKGGLLPSDISQAELKQVYGALSDDLANTVRTAGGPRASAAFERANKYYGLVSERRENLARILNVKSDEGVFSKVAQLAGSSSSADAKLLAQARKAMPEDEWAEVSSAVIGSLGRNKSAGTSLNVAGGLGVNASGEFSPNLFVRDYGKLSPAGKTILFNSAGTKGLRPYLDDIAKVSERAKSWLRFANPSGTAQNMVGVGQITGAGAAGYAAIGGSFVEPLTAIGGVIGTSMLSRALSRSVTAAPIAQWSKAYEMAVLRPGGATFSTLQIASRNLANTLADKLGINVNPTDLLKGIMGPGPVPIRAGGEQPVPGPDDY